MTERRLRILILGGYGTFGGRLAELLRDEPRIALVIAGRSSARAAEFAAGLGGRAATEHAMVDRDADLVPRFAELAPDLVVDASGPFQAYGDDPYRVVEAALAAGAHYVDLADGSAFVRGIGRFDAQAKRAGRFVLAGVSSCPALTAAVTRSLATGLARIDSIAAGIAPSPYARVGENVIRAIASYAGRPVAIRRAGSSETAYPFTETRSYTIAPPGRVPLASRTFSLVAVPDLELLADLWPEVESVWVGAAPAPAVLHAALRTLARAVRAGVVPSLVPLASLMHRATLLLRWGEHRGGMFVEVEGRARNGMPIRRSWHLLAEGDDGPLIPSMGVAAVVRNVLDGRSPPPGARAATRGLELDDYAPAFARRRIHWGERCDEAASAPLYRRVLGASWDALPASLRTAHGAAQVLAGRARIVAARNPLARAIATAFGFPRAAEDVPVRVTFERASGVEVWRRDFDGRALVSTQYEGDGREARLLCERFGPFVFAMALVVEPGKLRFVVRRWRFLGMPLPAVLAPRGDAFEAEIDGVFHFHVEIVLPLLGRVVAYSGDLRPVAATSRGDG